MVIGLIRPAIIVAQQLWKYRKQIYSVVSAQDRYIKGAFVGTRVSKAAQYGWRSGAAIGGLTGSLNYYNADDSPGNGVPKIQQKSTPGKPDKTRSRQTTESYSRYSRRRVPYSGKRCPRPRKRF